MLWKLYSNLLSKTLYKGEMLPPFQSYWFKTIYGKSVSNGDFSNYFKLYFYFAQDSESDVFVEVQYF